VRLTIDPALQEETKTVTLAYTFFDITNKADRQ